MKLEITQLAEIKSNLNIIGFNNTNIRQQNDLESSILESRGGREIRKKLPTN